ncbi:MAG: InlB B-repeat-containing protein [Clostridia bacterium]|nr:InlB B-repeat-containing protein [Clostridia bacterium]
MKKFLLGIVLVISILFVFSSCITSVEFDVNFMVEGEVYYTISTSGTEALKMPENPTKDGFTFGGWFWDDKTFEKPFTANSILDAPLSSNMNVYPKWIDNSLPEDGDDTGDNATGGDTTGGNTSGGDTTGGDTTGGNTTGGNTSGGDTTGGNTTGGNTSGDNTGGTEQEKTKYTVTFDPNGGRLDAADMTLEIGEGEGLPTLPKPSRNGAVYKFLGWFRDGDDTEKYKKGEKVNEDMTLVALWEIIGEKVMIEFDPGDGTLEGKTYIELPKGERLSEVLKSLPNAILEGYKLGGWYLPDGTKIGLTTIFDADTILTAKWDVIVYCKDGTENHDYGGWVDKTLKATCTEPKTRAHTCSICGHEEVDVIEPATGHMYGDWINGTMERTRTCITCGAQEIHKLSNVTQKLGYEATITLQTGDLSVYGAQYLQALIDGNFEVGAGAGAGMATKANEISILLTLKEAQWVDIICISSNSFRETGSVYELIITYEDGTTSRENQFIGTMGHVVNADGTKAYKVSQFDISAKIKSVEMYIPMGTYGECFFGEIALGASSSTTTIPGHNFGEWQPYSEATCAKDGTVRRYCSTCGHYEERVVAPATGVHNYIGEATYALIDGNLCRTRECDICEKSVTVESYTNIAQQYATVDLEGNFYGAGNESALTDGNFTSQVVSPKGTGSASIYLSLTEPKYVDVIYIATNSTAGSYKVKVVYSDGEEATLNKFANGNAYLALVLSDIVSVEIYMENPIQGYDVFTEIALFTQNTQN